MALSFDRLGANIATYRKKRNVTQKNLSEVFDCPPESISRYENGRRKLSLDMLDALCQHLDVSYEELLSGATTAKIRSDQQDDPNWAVEEFKQIICGYSDKTIRQLLDVCAAILSMSEH